MKAQQTNFLIATVVIIGVAWGLIYIKQKKDKEAAAAKAATPATPPATSGTT